MVKVKNTLKYVYIEDWLEKYTMSTMYLLRKMLNICVSWYGEITNIYFWTEKKDKQVRKKQHSSIWLKVIIL
jgi:uncharacterized protein involved in tolerance to divalent cations